MSGSVQCLKRRADGAGIRHFVSADRLIFCDADGGRGKSGAVVNLLKKENVPYYVIGNGSNLLVGDGGYRGVVIQICKNMNKIRVEGDMVYAQAGALLSKTAAHGAGTCTDRHGICIRHSGNTRRCGDDECRSLRRRNETYFVQRTCIDKRRRISGCPGRPDGTGIPEQRFAKTETLC